MSSVLPLAPAIFPEDRNLERAGLVSNEVLQTARRTSLEHGRRAVRNRTSEQKARRPHRDAKGLLPAAERRLVEPFKKVPWSVVDRDRSLQILVRPSAAAEGDDCDFCSASSLNVVRSVANH